MKNTLLNSGKTLDRKIQEASLAWQLENHYSKQRILEIYLNTVYFGNGAYGVEAAAEQYFGTSVDQVDVARQPRSPGSSRRRTTTTPSPTRPPRLARRNVVLAKMAQLGDITPAQRDADVAPARRRADTDRPALPRGPLRGRGQELHPERPALRRHAR